MKALFTDLDDTLYHPAAPTAAWDVYRWCQAHGWRIAVVTGLGMTGYQARLASGELPPVDAVAAHVGTDIWYGEEQDEEFTHDVAHQGFDQAAMIQRGRQLIADWAQQQPHRQFDWQQPADADQPYKVSFYITIGDQHQVSLIRQELINYFKPYPVIISDHTAYNRTHAQEPKRYCVDVVPITKTGSVNYLINKWGVEGGVVAGDSGNDIDMLLATGPELISVLVGSAKLEAQEAIMAATKPAPARGADWRQLIGNPEKLFYLPADISLTPAILEACVLPR